MTNAHDTLVRRLYAILGTASIAVAVSGLTCRHDSHGDSNAEYHQCEIVEEYSWNMFSIGIQHNDGRQCPTPPSHLETYSHQLTIPSSNAITTRQNSLAILEPDVYNRNTVAMDAGYWECETGGAVCTSEQSVSFAPSTVAPHNYNYAESQAWSKYQDHPDGGYAYMLYRVVWSNAY